MDKENSTITNPPAEAPTPPGKTPQSLAPQSLSETPCYEPKYILTGLVVLIILGTVGFLVIRILPLREWISWLLR